MKVIYEEPMIGKVRDVILNNGRDRGPLIKCIELDKGEWKRFRGELLESWVKYSLPPGFATARSITFYGVLVQESA